MDPRFEWTTDRNFLLKEVTFGDEGNYNITHPHGIPFQTVHLTVSGTPVPPPLVLIACLFLCC